LISSVIIDICSIKSIWPMVKGFVERCDSETSKASDLYELLLNGDRGLVLVVDDLQIKGACIYRVIHGVKKTVTITTLGGDQANWRDAVKDFSAQLQALGFERLQIQGRRGWVKMFNEFEELHTTIGIDLC
jgi:hypothetical protein